jgi:hypothetical protein
MTMSSWSDSSHLEATSFDLTGVMVVATGWEQAGLGEIVPGGAHRPRPRAAGISGHRSPWPPLVHPGDGLPAGVGRLLLDGHGSPGSSHCSSWRRSIPTSCARLGASGRTASFTPSTWTSTGECWRRCPGSASRGCSRSVRAPASCGRSPRTLMTSDCVAGPGIDRVVGTPAGLEASFEPAYARRHRRLRRVPPPAPDVEGFLRGARPGCCAPQGGSRSWSPGSRRSVSGSIAASP